MPRIDRFLRLDRNTGKFIPNVDYRYCIPYKLTISAPDVLPINIPLASVKPVTTANFDVPNNAWGEAFTDLGTPYKATQFLIEDVTAGGSGTFTPLVWFKNSSGRDYMNRPVPGDCIGGDAKLPGRIIEPMYLLADENLYTELTNPASLGNAAPIDIRMYFSGIQYYPGGLKSVDRNGRYSQKLISYLRKFQERLKYVHPFWFTTEAAVSLAANATTSFTTKISDSHFEAFNLTVKSTGNFAVEITNILTGQTLMNGKITQRSSIGRARIPSTFPVPYLLQQGSILRWTFQDLSAATNNIFPVIQGRKILAPLQDVKEVTKNIDDIITPADLHASEQMEGEHAQMEEFFEEVR